MKEIKIHNFISSSGSGSDFLTSYGYGSGSARQKDKFGSYGSGYDFLTSYGSGSDSAWSKRYGSYWVPVPQHCLAD